MRVRASLGVALLVALPTQALAVSLPGESGEIVVGERQPLVMVVFTGKGGEGLQTHTSEILQIASDVLKKRTNLILLSPEQAGADPVKIAACTSKNRFSCWVRTVRSDYERTSLEMPDGGVMPYSEHIAELKHRGISYPRFLVVLGIYPDPGQADRVSAVLINTDEALQRYHDAYRKRGDWEEKVEDEIYERGAQAKPGAVEVSNAAGLKAYFEKLFGEELRPSFEKSGNWEPYGRIDVTSEVAGLVIDLDGKVIGQTRQGMTSIAEVAPGKRKLGFDDPSKNVQRYEALIEVSRGKTEQVKPLILREPSSGSGLKRITFWGGVGVAVLGAALTTYAVVQKPKDYYIHPCPSGATDCMPTPAGSFASFCDLGSGGPECLTGGKGLLVAPLGYSLLGMGGAWAAGAELLDGAEEVPWRSLLIGLGVGALSYGLSTALDKKN